METTPPFLLQPDPVIALRAGRCWIEDGNRRAVSGEVRQRQPLRPRPKQIRVLRDVGKTRVSKEVELVTASLRRQAGNSRQDGRHQGYIRGGVSWHEDQSRRQIVTGHVRKCSAS